MDEIVKSSKLARRVAIAAGVLLGVVLLVVAWFADRLFSLGSLIWVFAIIGIAAMVIAEVFYSLDALAHEAEVVDSALRVAREFTMPTESLEDLSIMVGQGSEKAAKAVLAWALKSLLAETTSLKGVNAVLSAKGGGASIKIQDEVLNETETIKLIVNFSGGSRYVRLWQSR